MRPTGGAKLGTLQRNHEKKLSSPKWVFFGFSPYLKNGSINFDNFLHTQTSAQGATTDVTTIPRRIFPYYRGHPQHCVKFLELHISELGGQISARSLYRWVGGVSPYKFGQSQNFSGGSPSGSKVGAKKREFLPGRFPGGVLTPLLLILNIAEDSPGDKKSTWEVSRK